MKDAPARHLLEYLPYLAGSRLMMLLPHAASRPLGRTLGAVWFRLDRSARKLAEQNLGRALPGLSADQRRAAVRACFAHFGTVLAEVYSASRFTASEVVRRFDIDGWDNMQNALELGRGVLALCGHYGSWQLAIYPLGLRLGGMHVVARAQDNPHVDQDMRKLRRRFRNVEIPTAGAGHRILSVIRSGGTVGVVIDQKVPPLTGIIVPFLGRPARTSPVPAFIALRGDTPAVPMTCRPIEGHRYHLQIHEPLVPSALGADSVEALTRCYIETVERDIRKQPELWLWTHDRWQLRPQEREAFAAGRHCLETTERAGIRAASGWRPAGRS